MRDRAVLIIAACIIRVASNALHPFWGGPALYYIGQAVFEALVMWVLFSFSEGKLKTILLFFFGLSCFAVVKEVFLKPTELDIPEYIGFGVGVLFMVFKPIRLWLKKIWVKRI